MNNNIQEDYCSFEVSKLLKEKGFNIPLNLYYNPFSGRLMKESVLKIQNSHKQSINAPTHSLAIKWIRENFGIHIYGFLFSITTKKYSWEIWDDKNEKVYQHESDSDKWGFNSPEEATEAALLYTLKNLI